MDSHPHGEEGAERKADTVRKEQRKKNEERVRESQKERKRKTKKIKKWGRNKQRKKVRQNDVRLFHPLKPKLV
jgi:hypothetical protein